MKKNKYKIAVLSDMGETTVQTLKSAVGLAKIINGEIELFHASHPIDIVQKDNQLSAKRTINKKHFDTDKKIKDLIAPISKEYGIPIKYSFALGNVKNEISDFMKQTSPDVLVLGKRSSSSFPFIGDNITEYVVKRFEGSILIASGTAMKPGNNISLGILNSDADTYSWDISGNLLKQAVEPLKVFKISESGTSSNSKAPSNNKKVVEFVFDRKDNFMDVLSGYLTKSKVDLLLMQRDKGNSWSQDLKTAVDKFDTSLLIDASKIK